MPNARDSDHTSPESLDDHHYFASESGRRDAIQKTKECLVLLLASELYGRRGGIWTWSTTSLDRLPVYIANLKEKIPQLIVQLAEASRELERKKKELADETVRRDEMIKSASRLATRIKNAVERRKEQELFLRIAESKASRLTEVLNSLVSRLREFKWPCLDDCTF